MQSRAALTLVRDRAITNALEQPDTHPTADGNVMATHVLDVDAACARHESHVAPQQQPLHEALRCDCRRLPLHTTAGIERPPRLDQDAIFMHLP